MPIPRTLNHAFFKTWSRDMAYVLGFFAADGSMLKNKRGGCYIEFHITDRCILELVRRATGSGHKIKLRPSRDSKWKPIYRLQIGSKRWFDDLTSLGFTQNKSKTLQFPAVPGRFVGDFVRGYFDGDGCVYFKELQYGDRVRKRHILMTLFTSGSKIFLISLWAVLKQYGVAGGTIQPKKRGFELKFSHRDSVALYRIMYNTVPVTDIYLPRKYRLLTKAIKILYPMRP